MSDLGWQGARREMLRDVYILLERHGKEKRKSTRLREPFICAQVALPTCFEHLPRFILPTFLSHTSREALSCNIHGMVGMA
jgi:hypothetical protein